MNKLHIPERKGRLISRLAAAAIAAVMAVCAVPQAAFGAGASDVYQFAEGGFYYTISAVSGRIEASVVGYDLANAKGNGVAIPATLGGYPVTSISSDAFAGQTSIASATIPQNVKTVGYGAFQNCTGLKSVSIAPGLTDIADSTFKGCLGLTTVSIPNTVTRIGTAAFEDCTALKTLTLAEGLRNIGNYAFRRCRSIETVNLPNSLETLGDGAFEECSALKAVKLSPAMTTINDFTFYKCTLLTSPALTENIINIGRYAFSECSAITSVEFPRSVLNIGASAYEGCRSLAVAIIPNSTNNISDTAFRNTPLSIYGYSGTYAENYAHRNGIPFTSYGAVYNITFSSDIYYATVDNISIKSASGTIIPPSTVFNDDNLTITATAPNGFVIDYITINGEPFINGSTYRVHNCDVSIFVSYRLKEVTTATTTSIERETQPPVTTSVTPRVTTVSTSATAAPPASTPSTDNTTVTPDDNSYISVKSDLADINGVNVRIVSQKENFIGPATVRLTNSQAAEDKCRDAAEDLGLDGAKIYPFDISLLDQNGNVNNGLLAKGTITFMIPVPNELLPYQNAIQVYHIVDGRAEPVKSSIIEDINGVRRVQFETDSFSPYMFVVDTEETVPVVDDEDYESQPVSSSEPVITVDGGGNVTGTGGDAKIIDDKNTPQQHNGNRNPYTGEMLAIGIPTVALLSALFIRNRHKRKRAKSDVK